jgi:tetratricopeptide (TPR) repeat protein
LARNKEIVLNCIFLKNRIVELGIKQWWLAEQVGVDRKTVIRWLQGKVKSVQAENVEALSKILDCQIADLTLTNQAEQLATIEDQKNAANLIVSSSLIEKLGPIGEWNVIEGLLKATIVPSLPANILGELYNQLTVASWRQSKVDQADIYNRKAEELALRSGDKDVLTGALLSKANILSWRGKTAQAIQVYRECLLLEKFIEKRIIGSTYSNLGAVLYESGDLDSGEIYQAKAIEVFTFHGKATNLSIAWCHLAMIYLQKDQQLAAKQACDKSIAFARQDDYRRGLQMGRLIDAEISVKEGRFIDANQSLTDGLNGFAELGIDEGLNYEFAGRISRLAGDQMASVDYFRKGISLAKDFPMYRAALYLELAKTLSANRSDLVEAKASAKKAVDLYRECEASIRAELANKFLDSIT